MNYPRDFKGRAKAERKAREMAVRDRANFALVDTGEHIEVRGEKRAESWVAKRHVRIVMYIRIAPDGSAYAASPAEQGRAA